MRPLQKTELSYFHEKILADGLVEVASELRMVDISDYIYHIKSENYANVGDLISSSAELYFKPGTITFNWSATLRVDWKAPPAVAFDLEFKNAGVTALFSLELEDARASVDIRSITFENEHDGPAGNTERFYDAVLSAKQIAGSTSASPSAI